MDATVRSMRREARTIVGRARAGKLAPCMSHKLEPGEGGMLNQSVTVELDPVAGRIITPVTVEAFSVYVPTQAMDLLKSPPAGGISTAGNTEILRQRLLQEEDIFGLEGETQISRRCRIKPIKVAGVARVSAAVRLAHNAAVNHLRLLAYPYAAQLDAANDKMTPALLSSTVLDRFRGVLDPDEHVNGLVNMSLSGSAPVPGVRVTGPVTSSRNALVVFEAARTRIPNDQSSAIEIDVGVSGGGLYADLSAVEAGGMSLTDLFNAQRMDKLARAFRAMVEADPVGGEDRVVRWCHGLSVDTGTECFLLHRASATFGTTLQRATDAAGLETETAVSRMVQRLSWAVPVPRTELGGIVMTFVSVKPDEAIVDQPHPFLAAPWKIDNRVADEFVIDPVGVTGRQLSSNIPLGSENTVMFYTGFNSLKRLFVDYGFDGEVDPSTVEHRNAIWQLAVPASVTPENVIYPDDISHFPFLDQMAQVALHQCDSQLVVASPLFFGPSPVETVAAITAEGLFPSASETTVSERAAQ